VSGNSKYDQYVLGDESALNDAEIRGMELFFSDQSKCSNCHTAPLFTDGGYHNVGLYNEYPDIGREAITLDPQDNGKFMTPSLRNIALSPPYMHDGSMQTLEEVVAHFNSGGMLHPVKDEQLIPLNLTEQEQSDLVSFLLSLSDEEFVTNPDHQP
jgi:cytochrome c peroxidase